jgi:hypothetical protein
MYRLNDADIFKPVTLVEWSLPFIVYSTGGSI